MCQMSLVIRAFSELLFQSLCQTALVQGVVEGEFDFIARISVDKRMVRSGPRPRICWLHRSSFKGYSTVFPAPSLAKVESSQKSNGMWFPDIFSRHFCSTVAKTIGLTNYATSFGAKKCSENHI